MKPQILLVDDEPCVLEVLQRSLHANREMWQFHFAHSVDAALERVAAMNFDTIVSDIHMPGKDGFVLLEAMRACERTKDIPIIILTGSLENDLKRRALDLGATDLLTKPINREDLVARLRSTLRLKAYQDALRGQNAILHQKVQERTRELEQSRLDIVWRLGKAAEFRDEGTGNHIIRVGCYCRAIAEAMGMSREFVEQIFLASPLHDIGKIGIPDHILLKPGKLTQQEWAVMQGHCDIGARILREGSKMRDMFYRWEPNPPDRRGRQSPNPLLDMAVNIALMHHERQDGAGYPRGLVGAAIPVEASIVMLADVYDALRTARPYKPAYSEAQALHTIRARVGSHFDPLAHAGFEKAVETIRGIQAQLSDEEPVHLRGAA